MAMLFYSIAGTVEQDYRNMGILKITGFTDKKLRSIQLFQYMIVLVCAMAAGLLMSCLIAGFVCRMTVTTIGLLIPSGLPVEICLGIFTVISLILIIFVWLCTGRIGRISPVDAIRGTWKKQVQIKKTYLTIKKRRMICRLALRQFLSGKKRYIGVCTVAVLLVFFASLIGRVNSWLGPSGEGLMDAFNPADLHIAAQPMGETTIDEVEQTIEEYTTITDSYELAMPSVSVKGMDTTANVITEPERFHILEGKTCSEANEVVLTEFEAADLGVSVGDSVDVSGSNGSSRYIVSGIYQCANDMGMSMGMNREGYLRIGDDSPTMWCSHYFLEDPLLQPEIMQILQDTYGGDVYIHENSWPGLAGVISAMHYLMIFLYMPVIVFVLVVTLLTTGKLLRIEERDLSIYRIMGFSADRLRLSFALRFGGVALLGSVFWGGAVLSALSTDPLVGLIMRMEGISDFSSRPNVFVVLFPVVAVALLFSLFAYYGVRRIQNIQLYALSEG